GFGCLKRRLQHSIQDLDDRCTQLSGLGATRPGAQRLVLLQQVLFDAFQQVLTVTEVQQSFGEFYRFGALQGVAQKSCEALADSKKGRMVDRGRRLSADCSVAPERVEVLRKPLGEPEVLLF